MKHAAAIAHFRQLCCLNLDPQTLMPTALQTLHDLIGSDSNGFYWSTSPGRITNVYLEEPMPREISTLYFDEFLNNPTRPDSAIQIRNVMRPGQVVGNSARLFPTTFYESDKYNLIWRPLRRRWLLWAVVRDQCDNLHGVVLRRLNGESPFSEYDEERLAQLLPYFVHAVNASVNNGGRFLDRGASGLIVMDRHGKVCYQSEEGQRLLLLSANKTLHSGSIDTGVLPMQLRRLRAQLSAISAGHNAVPPVEVVQNSWGKFVFRAHYLNGMGADDALIGVVIQRQVPIALKLLETMRALDLSARQKEVCLLLAEGMSHPVIAARLAISRTTIADHVHKIYDKLSVHSHEELLSRLTADETLRRI